MSNRVLLAVTVVIACAAGSSRASDNIGAVIVTERPVLKSDRSTVLSQRAPELGNTFAFKWSSSSPLDRALQPRPASAPIDPDGYLGGLNDLAPDLATIYEKKRALIIPGGSRGATPVTRPVLLVTVPVLLIIAGGVLFVRMRHA